MTRYLWPAVYLLALVALLWPTSRVGGAVIGVTSGLGNVLNHGAGQFTGGASS